MVRIIAINGTPGTGKTTVAEKLVFPTINLSEFARENNCVVDYDNILHADVVDEDLLMDALRQYISDFEGEVLVIEGHLADLVPPELLDICFVLQVDLSDLILRLRRRNYSERKIEDNKNAEIMKECFMTSLDAYGAEKVKLVPIGGLSDTVAFIEKFINELVLI